MHIDIDVHIHRHSHKHIHIHRHRTLADSTKLGIRPPELNVRHGRSCCQHKKKAKRTNSTLISATLLLRLMQVHHVFFLTLRMLFLGFAKTTEEDELPSSSSA